MDLHETNRLFNVLANQQLFDLVNAIQTSTRTPTKRNTNAFIRALESELLHFLF